MHWRLQEKRLADRLYDSKVNPSYKTLVALENEISNAIKSRLSGGSPLEKAGDDITNFSMLSQEADLCRRTAVMSYIQRHS
ncbi:MAG: hypothetical protein Q8Q42_02145 [Nanoarchaeota archaeon]|nr:hypothetical protein [Nanoarchaeota archaeon]